MQTTNNALPVLAPATVSKAARLPLRPPVVTTSVTIGPGTITRTATASGMSHA